MDHPRAAGTMRVRVGTGVTKIAATVLLAVVVGAVLPASPLVASLLVLAVVVTAVAACFGVLGLAILLVGTLPWLVTMSDLLPRLTVTFASGAAAGAILLIAAPRSTRGDASLALKVGMVFFFAPIVLSLGRQGAAAGAVQAAKYVLFPAMAFVVADATNERELGYLRTVAFWSSVGAITVNLIFGLTGFANSSYYGSGEILGYGSEHELALLAGCVTAAALASSLSLAWSPVIAVGAIATVATGVRSTLPGLMVAAFARMLSARVRLRVMVLVGLAVAGIFFSGAAHVVETRFHTGEKGGEFQSFSNFGSGRGSIYQAALHIWWNASPFSWIVGTGLRSILGVEQEVLGQQLGGHSDIVDVLVQIGIAGLIGLVLIWFVLFAKAKSRLPLVILVSFAVFTGILEVSGPLVIGMLLATGTNVVAWPRAARRGIRATRVPPIPPLWRQPT
jgi:O-Antigen ligase